MNAIIDRLWEKDEPFIFVTKEQYAKNLEGWDIQTHVVDGELIFVALVKGPVFHFQSMGTGRPVTMKVFRNFLQPIIDTHGYAETHAPHEDERQRRFNLLVGFVEVGRDEFDAIFRIERFYRCQSSR